MSLRDVLANAAFFAHAAERPQPADGDTHRRRSVGGLLGLAATLARTPSGSRVWRQ